MEILGHLDLGGNASGLACPYCGVTIGGLSAVVDPALLRQPVLFQLCPRCAAIFVLVYEAADGGGVVRPVTRSASPAELEKMRNLPNADQIKAIQRKIELEICPND